MNEKFNKWYEKNRSYFFVKHEGDEKKMEEDATQSYNTIKMFEGKPAMQNKTVEKKKKANPYGF